MYIGPWQEYRLATMRKEAMEFLRKVATIAPPRETRRATSEPRPRRSRVLGQNERRGGGQRVRLSPIRSRSADVRWISRTKTNERKTPRSPMRPWQNDAPTQRRKRNDDRRGSKTLPRRKRPKDRPTGTGGRLGDIQRMRRLYLEQSSPKKQIVLPKLDRTAVSASSTTVSPVLRDKHSPVRYDRRLRSQIPRATSVRSQCSDVNDNEVDDLLSWTRTLETDALGDSFDYGERHDEGGDEEGASRISRSNHSSVTCRSTSTNLPPVSANR